MPPKLELMGEYVGPRVDYIFAQGPHRLQYHPDQCRLIEMRLFDGTTTGIYMRPGEQIVEQMDVIGLLYYVLKPRAADFSAVRIIKFPEGVIGFSRWSLFRNENSMLPSNSNLSVFSELRRVHFPSTLESLPFGLFLGCNNLETVNIPAKVGTIPQSCFERCRRLRDVVLPPNLRRIEDHAFCGSGLEAIDIPPNVLEIRGRAFFDCEHLSRVGFGTAQACKLETIAFDAFMGTNVRRVRIPPSVTRIGRHAFFTMALNAVYFEGPRLELASLFDNRAPVDADDERRELEQERFPPSVELVLCDNPRAFVDNDVKRVQFPNVQRENYGVRIPPGFETLRRRLDQMGLLNPREREGAQAFKDEMYRDMVAFLAAGGVRQAMPVSIAEHIVDQRPAAAWFEI